MSEFDIFFDEYENKHNCSPEKYECFEASQQSQQAKIDSLSKNIEALHVENDRIQKEYQMMFEGVQGRQKTIDELQARIDEALRFYNEAKSPHNIGMIQMAIYLKGNKDEN